MLLAIGAGAQNNGFQHRAPLSPVERSAFYKIVLPPPVTSKCMEGLPDLRIQDKAGNQVPYIVQQESAIFQADSFIAFPVLHTTKGADKLTRVIIQNPAKSTVNHLLLFVRNFMAGRSVNISGSNDGKQWYVIDENVYFDSQQHSDTLYQVQTLSFKPVNYGFYQITFLGENTEPVHIIKAGKYKKDLMQGKYTALPAPAISQKDSGNFSYVKLRFSAPYDIARLQFTVAGPKYFKRRASLYNGDDQITTFPYSFDITTGSTITYLPGNRWSRQLLLKINNEDNPQLQMKAVAAWQLNKYLFTYLESGKDYWLVFGDSSATMPNYDLVFFKDSIAANPPVLGIGDIESKTVKDAVKPERGSKLLLWVCLGAGLVVLLLLTLRLVREMPGRK